MNIKKFKIKNKTSVIKSGFVNQGTWGSGCQLEFFCLLKPLGKLRR